MNYYLINDFLKKKLCFVLQSLVFQDNDFEVSNIKSEIETFILDYCWWQLATSSLHLLPQSMR